MEAISANYKYKHNLTLRCGKACKLHVEKVVNYGGGNHREGGGGCGIQGVDMAWAIRQNGFLVYYFKHFMGHGGSWGLARMGMGIHAYGGHARAWACGCMGVWG